MGQGVNIKIFFLSFLLLFFGEGYAAARKEGLMPPSKKGLTDLSRACSPNTLGSEIHLLKDFEPQEEHLSKGEVKTFLFRTQSGTLSSLRPGCVTITPLTYADGRYKKFTTADQIFLVSVKEGCFPPGYSGPSMDRLLFIVKHYAGNSFVQDKVEDEITSLCVIRKAFSSQGFSKDLPRFSFAEDFYKYPNPNAGSADAAPYRYIALLHAAKGENLWDLVEKYIKTENDEEKAMLRQDVLAASTRLGEVLAHLHLKFMEGTNCPYRLTKLAPIKKRRGSSQDIGACETKIHGDLHFKNIFWDKKTNIISFIDMGTFTQKPSPLNFIEELGYLYGSLINFTTALFGKGDIEFLKRKTFIVDIYSAFLTAYLQVFRAEHSGEAYTALQRMVKTMVLPMAMIRAVGSGAPGDVAGPAWKSITEGMR